jgi:hypothetical protein
MLWWLFRWLIWQPRYEYRIVAGTSRVSADDAAAKASITTACTGREQIGIAADGICRLNPDTGHMKDEWNVFVPVRR